MKRIDFQELPVTPWKNGGCVTRELACYQEPDSILPEIRVSPKNQASNEH